jgi:hypothetical protein
VEPDLFGIPASPFPDHALRPEPRIVLWRPNIAPY